MTRDEQTGYKEAYDILLENYDYKNNDTNAITNYFR